MGRNGQAERRHDIDVIRVVLFALLMVYHTALIFGTRSWLLQANSPNRAFDLLLLALHPWRLGLLFLVSGISTAALAKRLAPADIRKKRSLQLIPPLLLGIFVLVPPQIYLALKAVSATDLPYLDFWEIYLRFGTITAQDGKAVSLVSLQHLWFIGYLWLYTVVLTLGLAFLRGWLSPFTAGLKHLLQGRGLLVWPILYLAVLRLVFFPIFGETMEVGTDWYAHILYFSLFTFGYVIAEDEKFWATAVGYRRHAALVAVVSLAILACLLVAYPPGARSLGVTVLHRVGRSMFQWSAMVAILGYGRALITGPHPVITYLNRSVLTCYVLHQTVLIAFAYWWMRNFGLDTGSFFLIVVATIACCLALYEVQRQLTRLLKAKSTPVFPTQLPLA